MLQRLRLPSQQRPAFKKPFFAELVVKRVRP
jgi:hypothetical protein